MKSTIVLVQGVFTESASRGGRQGGAQRLVTREALLERSGARPRWKELPSWFVFGADDRKIPATAQRYVAERAGAQRVVEILGASHAVSVSQPRVTADLILEGRVAARGRLTLRRQRGDAGRRRAVHRGPVRGAAQRLNRAPARAGGTLGPALRPRNVPSA